MTEGDRLTGTAASLVLVFAVVLVLGGLIAVLIHRFRARADNSQSDLSVTRPVLAISLVGSVIVLASASLIMVDETTRSLLIGGVVSLSSAATAFYFASAGATEARRDLLHATAPQVEVPDVEGLGLEQANLKLREAGPFVVDTAGDVAAQGAIVRRQFPRGGQRTPRGAGVLLMFDRSE